MANRSPTIIDRADEVDTDLVPEPWDDRDAAEDQEIVTRRERYRLQGVTDGQGAGIVPAYNLNVADTEAIPQETKDGWTRGSAGRVLGPDGKYVSRGSDVPRKSYDGDEAGLLVEAAQRTNEIPYSADISEWNRSDASVSRTAVTSVFEGETAQKVSGDAGTEAVQQGAGTFSGGDETFKVLLEESSANKVRIEVRNLTTQSDVVTADYLFADDSFSAKTNGTRFNSRTIASGPNGADLRVLEIGISSGNAENTSSENRQVLVYPSRSGNADATIIHGAQLEAAPNSSSWIVTGASATTRAADDYKIFEGGQPPWWNPNEGTFCIKTTPLVYSGVSFTNQAELKGDQGSFLSTQNSGNSNPPWPVASFDGNTSVRVKNAVSPFQKNKIAISFTQSSRVISAGGSSSNGSHNGNLLNSGDVALGRDDALIASYSKIIYIHRALPESTLNRITS